MSPFSIIGILNVTPDSYLDGGKYSAIEQAVERAGEMLNEGADIIEIGGESTGPDSSDVSEVEELERVLPIVDALRDAYPDASLAIDTWKSAVALQAVERGVQIVNDVTAGRADPKMLPSIAPTSVKLALMYAKDTTPRTTVEDTQYDDVVTMVKNFLSGRMQAAEEAGIAKERLILDPGMGHFVSSDPRHSFTLLKRLTDFQELGCSILLSPSRKSFLAGNENLAPIDRLPGTIAASAIAVLHGAQYIRTHDVAEVRRGCEIGLLCRSGEYDIHDSPACHHDE